VLYDILAVGAGGFAGANARFLLAQWINARVAPDWPWATFAINVTGSLLIGFGLVLMLERVDLDPRWRLLFVTGFLGAYTTFSTYSWELLALLERRDLLGAALYALGSVVVGLGATTLGALLARWL